LKFQIFSDIIKTMNNVDWGKIGRNSGLGFTLVGTTLAGFIIGYFLDKLLGTTPILRMLLFILGIVGGFVFVIREAGK